MGDPSGAIAAYRATLTTPLRQVTLCLLRRGDEVLLARKKRGFGMGRWTGVGGKPLLGESLLEAAVRETREEIGVEPRELEQVASLSFYFPHVPVESDWNQHAIVFVIRAWEGEPSESDEVAPEWFAPAAVPYDEMWADGRHWLPPVLRGERITADFLYDATHASLAAYVVISAADSV
jgi:ADP-ribose pyrophosphatase YjhB (NUDIX family)